MSKVKAKVTCFIDNSLRNEGDEFEYNGPKKHECRNSRRD